MNELIRIDTPLAGAIYQHTIHRTLLLSGFAGNPHKAVEYLIRNAAVPALGLWVGRSDLEECGAIACVLPTTPLSEYPEITMFANWGPREIGRLLMDQAVQHGWDAGYVRLRAMNRTGRPDELCERHYRRPGRTIERLGTLFEFTEYPPEKVGKCCVNKRD